MTENKNTPAKPESPTELADDVLEAASGAMLQFEIQDFIISPRDVATGQSSGIFSPRGPQSGLPTGK